MEFIDHNGHIFSLPSYKTYPVGYEYDEQPYIFWLNDNKKLSTKNYYIKPIRFIINEDDYDLSNTSLHIKIESSYYKLMGSYHLNNLLNKSKNLFDYLTISSDMFYWEDGNYDSISNEKKNGYIKFDLLKDSLNENDILSVQHLKGEYGDVYTMITFYVVGYSDDELVITSNILLNLTENKKEEYCVITIGGEFVTENESLIINGKNMGIDLPKDIVRAVYQSSFYNYNIDNELYNSKLKELLLNYMSIKGECGNYNSALSAFKWFGWGNKISINKLIQTDNEFVNQYIIDSFDITNDMLYSYKNFKNTTYIKLNIFGTIESDEYNELNWDNANSFWGEGNPKIKEIVKDNIKVVYEETDMGFYKQYYDFCFEELGLKLSALEYYYKKYFLPIHIFIHSASISYQCFMNPNKLIVGDNKTLYSEKPILVGDVYHNADTSNMLSNSNVTFIDKHYIMYYTQNHFIDRNFNEFNKYLLTPEGYVIYWNNFDSNAFWNKYLMKYDLFWVNENCLTIPMKFTQKNPTIIDETTACEYYECKLLLEKIDKSLYNYLYTFDFSIDYTEALSLNFIDGTKNPYDNIKISHKLYEHHSGDRLLHKTDNWSEYMFFNEFKSYIKTNYFDYVIFGTELPQLELKIESKNKLSSILIDNIDYLNLTNMSIIDDIHNIIYETSFNFIQYLNYIDGTWKYDEKTLYKNFVILPKILGTQYNINFWLNNEFNIYINVNGHWFTYNFNCTLPELQMNIGKLKYKYYADIDESYRNQFGDVTFFKQLNKLTNDNVLFNCFMWQPELVQVNNIDFFNNLLNYYKTYQYNITYKKKDEYSNDYNLEFYPTEEGFIEDIPLNELYYVFYIGKQSFFISQQLIKQYFINENHKSLNLPIRLLSGENKKQNWIALYTDNELQYIPVFNENTEIYDDGEFIDYEGSSGIYNTTLYNDKNGFDGENIENYLIQNEEGKTLVFNTINSSTVDTSIYDSDNEDNFIVIMETEDFDEERSYINLFFELDENNSVKLYIYTTSYEKEYLTVYSSIYKNQIDLYNKYKEFPNIVNNSKYLNKLHLYDIYKNGKLLVTDKTINLPELYNVFFNQDEQITSKINIPNSEHIYDLYIMKTPYDKSDKSYQWYSLFISKLPINKYSFNKLEINDYQKEFTLKQHVEKLTYIEKNELNTIKFDYGYKKINEEIINNVILEHGISISDLYIVFNTTLKFKYSDTNNEDLLNISLCEYMINSIYNVNIASNEEAISDIGLYWNVEQDDYKYNGIHWTTIPLNNVYCPWCGAINSLYYIGNDDKDETGNIKNYKCANKDCAAYIGDKDENGNYIKGTEGDKLISIEDASTVYWNNTLRYTLPYKLLYTLSDDTLTENNPDGRYHPKQVYIPERYSFSMNSTTKYIYSYYDTTSETYSYLINNDINSSVDIIKEYNYINYDNMKYDESRETYVNTIYSDITNSYLSIDFIDKLNTKDMYSYYAYINNITIYYKDIYDYDITNNYNNFYLLYDNNILYNDSWEVVINKSTVNYKEDEIINIFKQSNGDKLDWVINDNFDYNNFDPKLNKGNFIFTEYSDLTSDDYYIYLPKYGNNYKDNDLYIKLYTLFNEELYIYINNELLGSDSNINIKLIDSIYKIYKKDKTGKYEVTTLSDVLTGWDGVVDSLSDIIIYIEVNGKKVNLGKISTIKSTIITDNSIKPNYYVKEECVYTINKKFIQFTDAGIPTKRLYLDTYQNLFILTQNKIDDVYIWDKLYIYKLYINTPVNLDTVGSDKTLYSVNTKQFYPTDYMEFDENNSITRKIVHYNYDGGNKLWYLVNNNVYMNNISNPEKWKSNEDTEVLVYINEPVNIEDKHWYYTINGIEYEYKGSLEGIQTIGNNYINIDLIKQGEEPIFIKLNYIDAVNANEEYYDKIDYYTFKHVKSSERFLINRMEFVSTNGKNHFNTDDIIVTNISSKMNKDTRFNLEFKFDYGSKWLISPVSLKTNASDVVESTTEMGIISIGNNKIKYDRGYYDIICKYSIDSNTQNLYSLKSRILIK